MENLDKGLSTVQELKARIDRNGQHIINLETSSAGDRLIITFADGTQANAPVGTSGQIVGDRTLWKATN